MDLNKVAERFKELRFRTQKSQMELADALGVDQKESPELSKDNKT